MTMTEGSATGRRALEAEVRRELYSWAYQLLSWRPTPRRCLWLQKAS